MTTGGITDEATITHVARVMLESPLPQLDRLFDYRIPEALLADARPGVRVKVPLRTAGRVSRGYIVDVTDHGDYVGTLSDLDEIVSAVPVLTPDVWRLVRRVADRSAGNASDVVRLAVPPRQVRVEKAWQARQADAPTSGEQSAQRLQQPMPREHLTPAMPQTDRPAQPARVTVTGYGAGVVERAVEGRGRFALDAIPTVTAAAAADEAGDAQWVGAWAATMAAMAVFTLGLGRSSILVVPDYRDQEQLETAVEALLAQQRAHAAARPSAGDSGGSDTAELAGDSSELDAAALGTGARPKRATSASAAPIGVVARLNARQSNSERYANFLACLEPVPRIIIGTRSAVYAPAHELGLIALWDEADPLHDEPLGPYVASRDVALIRQEQAGCALAFVAHSRSTEVQRLVELGFVKEIAQHPRYLPKVVPTSAQSSTDRLAQSARIPSSAWTAVRTALQTGPVLVQVARPGYSPVLACTDCANPAHCLVCDGPLRAASRSTAPSCAWCGALAAQWQCRTCQGTRFTYLGQGSARTAEELGRAFPATRVIVSDGTRSLGVVGAEPALVVATRGAEPVAAGGYHAVLLLDGERMLARESLTVAEDCLRWWANAIALAAPRAPSIIVGVGGDLARTLVTWQHARFASAELVDRRRLRFAPAVRVATVRGTPDAVAAAVKELHDSVHGEDSAKIDVLGPVPDENDFVRSIVRFDYSVGASVAATLRAAVIKNATSRRKTPGRPTNYRTPPTLRVRFDDREIFD